MSSIDDLKELLSSDDVKEKSKNLIEDLANAMLENPVSAVKVLLTIIEAPYFIREKLFLVKFKRFLKGIYQQESDIEQLKYQLALKDDKQENAKRILYCIDKVETDKKVDYLINVTRALINDIIDLSTYFRICNVVVNTFDEDLGFLRERIDNELIPECVEVQGLSSVGLMKHTVFDAGDIEGNAVQLYSFTELAKIVDICAISYNDDKRYPNPKEALKNLI